MLDFIKRIFSIISKKDKRRLIIILIGILFSSFLDLISISSILPIVSLLSAPNPTDVIQADIILRILSSIFNTVDTKTLSILSIIFIILVYLIKVVYSFLLTYINGKFTKSFNRRLRERLMRIYLAMPYEYHHENNSSTLIRKSTYDVDAFTNAVNGLLIFTVKLATAIVIIIYLFISSYISTLIIGSLLFIFAFIIIFVLKKRTKVLGKRIQELNNNNYKYLSQSFNGIKESKISNTEEFFVNQYTKNIVEINKYSLRYMMISSIPSNTLEFVGILGMVISLLVIMLIGVDENYQIISTFSLFAYAVIRLLPCVIAITGYINNFSYYSSSVDSIYKDLEEVSSLEESVESYNEYNHIEFNNKIVIQKVSFAYRDEPEKLVVNNVSFEIYKNTSIAISGKSGAGKTTMVDIILGLLKPTSGTVYCDDIDINENVRGWRNNISYVPQNIYLMDDTIRNNIVFGVQSVHVDDKKIWEALNKAQLSEFVRQLPKGLDTVIGERGIRLSGGQRQRVGIARAFYRNTNVIVLDEATSALDYETEKNILDHVSKYSIDHTLIIITHRLNTIESCDYIYQIIDGKVECIKGK